MGPIQLPGSVGGADWQSGAFDPETGILYVQSITTPFTADIVKPSGKSDLNYVSGHSCLDSRPAGPAALQAALRPHHRHRFEQGRAALDDAERRRSPRPPASEAAQPAAARQPGAELSAGDQDARLSGRRRPGHGGARLTVAARDASDARAGLGRRKFRAFDKATGAILWETELPSGVTGAPMTYMFDGKQYIVAAIGNTEEERAGFVALSLP